MTTLGAANVVIGRGWSTFSRWFHILSMGQSGPRYDIVVERNIGALSRDWDAATHLATASAFQSPLWLGTWYSTIGAVGGQPMRLTAVDRKTGQIAVVLPLVLRRVGSLRVIEFADQGISDNNGPLLGPAAPRNAREARSLWTGLLHALPKADLVRFTKMPAQVGGAWNPMILLRAARHSRWSRNVISIEGSWSEYLSGLKRVFRKQIDRSWRAFNKVAGGTFVVITDPDEADRVLAELERQQSTRMRGMDSGPYLLDQSEFAAFYRRLIAEGVPDGRVVFTALTRDNEVVSALLGIVRGQTCVMIRISMGSQAWAHCSPGRLLILQTMQMLHQQGYRYFDLSIGESDYKRRLGAQAEPLYDFTVALTPRGMPIAMFDLAKSVVRRHPRLRAFAWKVISWAMAVGMVPGRQG